jgi:hypothetical protein
MPKALNWTKSRTVGGATEITLLTPIIPGRIPGERRTYEERLRFVLSSLAQRVEAGIPTPLSQINTFHFARVAIIRPEQYLVNSDIAGLAYNTYPSPVEPMEPPGKAPVRQTPAPVDAYDPVSSKPFRDNGLRSLLLTHVIFDGDPRVYARDIVEFIEKQFDVVFENCEDYPSAKDYERFWIWVRRFQLPVDVFYAAYPDLSVAKIRRLEDFRKRFDAFVARVRTPTGRRVGAMDDLFDEFLRETQQYASGFPSPGGLYKGVDDTE